MKRRKVLLIGVLAAALLALPLLLGAANPSDEAFVSEEMRFLATVRAFLDFGRDYAEFCQNESAVAVTAAMTIKDLYAEDDLDEAAAMIEDLLEKTKPQPARNALRMALKEVYEETDQRDKAADQLAKLVTENSR